MIVRLIIAVLAIFGVYLMAALWWPGLFNTAFVFDKIPINSVEIISLVVFCLTMKS